uniref:Immunoglobulin like and fibronectin type III domain containing 1, tandem duplicate 2 n=1 Tax=Myripristis murdjan TaxID=586833 RepID=A0A667WBQ6_9TELE
IYFLILTVAIKKRSRVPGVMITQYVENIPAGKSTPDFSQKPISVTVQEGKKAVFKAVVTGEPAPTVTWGRNRNTDSYSHCNLSMAMILFYQIPDVKSDHADTFKCFATNEYGKAICTALLNVSEVYLCLVNVHLCTTKNKSYNIFTSLTTSASSVIPRKKQLPKKKNGEIDPKLWELLLSAPRKDYEKICIDYGVYDFRWMLKRLKQLKKEREDEQAKRLDNVKQIEVKPNGKAEFELDMTLKDPNSTINLYKDGMMVLYGTDETSKHCLKQKGTKYVFTINDPQPEDAGFYQVDVEEVNTFSPLLVPEVEFIAQLKDVKAFEGEDAIFQCVLSTPLNRITWSTTDTSLENGDKYEITVSEDKLIHTLKVKDCAMADSRVYYAIAGIASSSATLTVEDRGVQFVSGLSDTVANTGEKAELSCKLSSETTEGRWYKDGKLVGWLFYSLKLFLIKSFICSNIEDPPKIDNDALGKFSEPVIVRAGENAEWKLPFSGGAPMSVQWYKDDEDLLPGLNVKIETSDTGSQLRLSKCQRKDMGEIKIKLKNEFGTIEATSKLIVLDKPTPPQGPVKILESAITSVEFKWKPPKDDGGSPITNYIVERQQVGRNKWSNKAEIPADNTSYKDSEVDPGRRYCYRIKAKNAEGVSDHLETEDIQAGVLRYPGPPSAPKVVSAFKDCINLAWSPPCDDGGSKIIGYNLEKHKKGTNYWSLVNQGGPITVKDVIEGAAYEFRVAAINLSGAGEPSIPCDTVFARDPMKPPGKVIDLKLTSSNYTTFSLAWTKPTEVKGVEDEAQGYYVEIRPIESLEWTRCNVNPITPTSFTVLGLKAMAMYWVRVIATNYGGDGEPQGFDNYIIAMPPPVKPKFKDRNMKSFVVVRSGNTVRLNINFEASPLPEIIWLKDGLPVPKHVTITNSDVGSQFLIPTAERSDTGIYTIIVKNIAGQETFNVEIRVTDDPKPPGPVELEQNVSGTVTLSWTPSPDEKRDDRLHYMVEKRDSFKRTWRTVADNLFNNKCTVINILPGREYSFRVFAKNDIGLSAPSESPVWGTKKDRVKFKVDMPEPKVLDFQSAPSFLVPLKRRMAPQGYECYMSCAIKGDPAPRVTWYRDNISLNTNTNYYITNVCGVCSLLILRVGPKDNGEYKIVIQNPLGTAESSMMLNVRGTV